MYGYIDRTKRHCHSAFWRGWLISGGITIALACLAWLRETPHNELPIFATILLGGGVFGWLVGFPSE